MMIYKHGNNFGHVTQMPGINFCSPTHKKSGFGMPSGFGGEAL